VFLVFAWHTAHLHPTRSRSEMLALLCCVCVRLMPITTDSDFDSLIAHISLTNSAIWAAYMSSHVRIARGLAQAT
jgi:amino acid permease